MVPLAEKLGIAGHDVAAAQSMSVHRTTQISDVRVRRQHSRHGAGRPAERATVGDGEAWTRFMVAQVFARLQSQSLAFDLLFLVRVRMAKPTSSSANPSSTSDACRSEPEYQDTVGPFFNFVPLRTVISETETFREVAFTAFDDLRSRFDVVVCEGAGSPGENE